VFEARPASKAVEVEVEEKEYIATGRKSETVSTVYQ